MSDYRNVGPGEKIKEEGVTGLVGEKAEAEKSVAEEPITEGGADEQNEDGEKLPLEDLVAKMVAEEIKKQSQPKAVGLTPFENKLTAFGATMLTVLVFVAAIYLAAHMTFGVKPTQITYKTGQAILAGGLKPLTGVQALTDSVLATPEVTNTEAEITDIEALSVENAVDTGGNATETMDAEALGSPDLPATKATDAEITDEQLYAVLGYRPSSRNPEDWEYDQYECVLKDIWDLDDHEQLYDTWLEVAQNPKASTELLHYVAERCRVMSVSDYKELFGDNIAKLADVILKHENCDWRCIETLSRCYNDEVHALITTNSPNVEGVYASPGTTKAKKVKSTWGQLYAVLGYVPDSKNPKDWASKIDCVSDIWEPDDYKLFYDTWLEVALSPKTSTELLVYVSYRCCHSTIWNDDFSSLNAVKLANAILQNKNCDAECIFYLSECRDDEVRKLVTKAS